MSVILQTGGVAPGAISTRSSSASLARRRASSIDTTPMFSPLELISRTSGTRMASFNLRLIALIAFSLFSNPKTV